MATGARLVMFFCWKTPNPVRNTVSASASSVGPYMPHICRDLSLLP